jgi:hypothetical protein
VIELVDRGDRLEIASPFPPGRRIVIFLAGLVPLIAPYELIWRVSWQTYWHPAFLFFALIALGAVAVSAFFVFAALAGFQSSMVFDRAASTFSSAREAADGVGLPQPPRPPSTRAV